MKRRIRQLFKACINSGPTSLYRYFWLTRTYQDRQGKSRRRRQPAAEHPTVRASGRGRGGPQVAVRRAVRFGLERDGARSKGSRPVMYMYTVSLSLQLQRIPEGALATAATRPSLVNKSCISDKGGVVCLFRKGTAWNPFQTPRRADWRARRRARPTERARVTASAPRVVWRAQALKLVTSGE